MPRTRKSYVWKLFESRANNIISCRFCTKEYKNTNATKMAKHISNCSSCPVNIKMKVNKTSFQESTTNSPRDPLQCITNTTRDNLVESCVDSNEMPLITSTQNTSQTSMTHDLKKDIDMDLAKAIFVTATPVSMVEHPLWKTVFNKLQPNYKLPSRKTVTTTYLDKIYNEMKNEIDGELKMSSFLHLQCDGWSNIRNEAIINFLVSKPEPLFVDFVKRDENRHTAEYIANEIIRVMSVYGVNKFVCVVGDNAANIQKAFENIKAMHAHIVPLRCIAHTLNLLCHDALRYESMKYISSMVIEVIKTIKNNQVLTALLGKICKDKECTRSVKLPCKTRWGSYLDCLERMEHTKPALQALAVHERASLRQDIKVMLLDESFWAMVSESVAVLKPITTWITKIESNDVNIHKVYPAFLEIERMVNDVLIVSNYSFNDNDKKNFLEKIKNRKNVCIQPIHLAAHLLDPSAQGIELNSEQDVEAMGFIYEMGRNINIEVMNDLSNFKSKQGLWAKGFIWISASEVSPLSWWTGICRSTNLSKIAARIFSAPVTSAATERSFSTFSSVHNKKRNRLTAENAGKITYVAYNWNLLHKKDFDVQDNEENNSEADMNEIRENIIVEDLPTFEPQPSTSGTSVHTDNMPFQGVTWRGSDDSSSTESD